jgi:holliday junction DNA helicase RuvA
MIAFLQGELSERTPNYAVINCAGVGYSVRISLQTYDKLPPLWATEKLYIYHQFTENGQTLFGFSTKEEQELFELIISVPGVGGSTALAILSGLSIKEFSDAIASQRTDILKGVKGIGAKTADRLVLELKGKIKGDEVKPKSNIAEEAITALTQLGYTKVQIEPKIKKALADNPSISLSDLIRLAMKL